MDDVPRPWVPLRARFIVVVLGSVVVAVPPVAAGTATAKKAGAEVALRKARFDPREVVVRPGEAVTWVHKDGGLPHSVVADDGSFNSHPTCGRPDGRCMQGGDRFTHTFTRPGTFAYYCRPHGAAGGQGMAGTVRVVS